MKRLLAGGACLIVTLGACATPSLLTGYSMLDGESRQVFLAYYPELTPEQRKAWMAGGDPYDLVKGWSLDSKFFRSSKQDGIRFVATPAQTTIRRLDVELPQAREPLSAPAALKATIHYADGRKADATEDVTWSVYPALAEVREHSLVFGCVASDVVVTADFLRERQGNRTVSLRKRLKSLELRISPEWTGNFSGPFVDFQIITHCEDGSSLDVSCQAEWSSVSDSGEVSGCGHFRLFHPDKVPAGDHQMRITASYGGQTVTHAFQLPRR